MSNAAIAGAMAALAAQQLRQLRQRPDDDEPPPGGDPPSWLLWLLALSPLLGTALGWYLMRA